MFCIFLASTQSQQQQQQHQLAINLNSFDSILALKVKILNRKEKVVVNLEKFVYFLMSTN